MRKYDYSFLRDDKLPLQYLNIITSIYTLNANDSFRHLKHETIYSELENVFGEMCFEGYTSFPEMEGGEKIFEDAASLCHGWAGIGCYIYNKYLLKKPC